MASGLLLGIDVGTTGCKASLYDLSGRLRGSGHKDHSLIVPRPGCVEENPLEWWEGVCASVRTALDAAGARPADIIAIGVSGTNATVAVDPSGAPLGNAIMQMDGRSADEVRFIREVVGERAAFEVTGNRIASGAFSLPSMLWLLRNTENGRAGAIRFMDPAGYIVWRLTGGVTMSVSRASTTLLFDIRKGCWDDSLQTAAGVASHMLPRLAGHTEIVGSVKGDAADECGLVKGIPVVAGSMDTVAAVLGAGGAHPGRTVLILGTVGRLCATVDRPSFDDRFVNCPGPFPRTWLSMAAMNGTGSAIRWFKEIVFQDGDGSFEDLEALAKESHPGAGGVVFLPYIAGERTPVWDENARGAFIGMSLSSTCADLARSVYEGVAYALRQNISLLESIGFSVPELRASGGGSRSETLCEIICEVTGRPVHVMDLGETETLGAALLAAVGSRTLDAGSALAIPEKLGGHTLSPEGRSREIYDAMFEVFIGMYPVLRHSLRKLVHLGKQQAASSRPNGFFYGTSRFP